MVYPISPRRAKVVKITITRNDPYVIYGEDITDRGLERQRLPSVEASDRARPVREIEKEAFCDGTHSRVSFEASEAAGTLPEGKPGR